MTCNVIVQGTNGPSEAFVDCLWTDQASDEAKALCRHAETDLAAHHSPDLFHGQHEVSKATSLHLARQVKQAVKHVTVTQAHWEAERAAEKTYHEQLLRSPGRPPEFERRIQTALTDLMRAEAEQTRAQARQSEARVMMREFATRSNNAETRHRLHDLSTQLLEPLRQYDHPLQALASAVREHIQQVDSEWADLFHADGTTAAERFFGRAHVPLFQQLTDRVPLPPPPRRRRPRPPKQPYLMPVAA